MERTLFLGSISSASRAKRKLAEVRIRARITKTDSSEEGCAWGLVIGEEDLFDAARILRAEGIRYETR